MIVRFANRDVRNEVFYKKKHIIDKRIKIREHLTNRNLVLLKEAQKLLGERNAWSTQTKIYGKVGSRKLRISSTNDLQTLKEMKAEYDEQAAPMLESDVTSTANSEHHSQNDPNLSSVNNASFSKVIDVIDQKKNDSPPVNNGRNVKQVVNFNKLTETWPDLTEHEVFLAVQNSKYAAEYNRNLRRGNYYNNFRGRGNPRRGGW